MTVQRCRWCSEDPLYIQYHDHEWGVPLYDEHALFEMLCLEGQQAGLAWIIVLKKREQYRKHFFQFSISDIAQFTDEQLEKIAQDPGIIRHLGKLKAIRDNAIAWEKMKSQGINIAEWLWANVNNTPIKRPVPDYKTAPTQSELSIKISKFLKKNGFKFVGPTIIYSYMQAVGMIDDHENDCFRKSTNS
jgi:DNA-3-methyladenine glycosylase I